MSQHPIVIYSCSGCSSAAQMSNWLAVKLDREGMGEMSCIAGVGGGVKPLVKTALAAQTIIGIDGCSLHCVKACLKPHGLTPELHYDLKEFGVKKLKHVDFDLQQAEHIWQKIKDSILAYFKQKSADSNDANATL